MSIISYTYPLPVGTHSPAVDYSPMATNSISINSILDIDLVGFNQVGSGFHKKSTYVNQGSAPSSAVGQYVEYSAQSSGNSEMFAVKDAAVTPIQLTRGVPGTSGTASYSYLPGGFLIQWGTVTLSSSSVPVSFPVAFTNPPTVTTTSSNARETGASSVTASGFNFVNLGGPSGYWMAIGT